MYIRSTGGDYNYITPAGGDYIHYTSDPLEGTIYQTPWRGTTVEFEKFMLTFT